MNIGSPCGYYVHWLAEALRGEFLKAYHCSCDRNNYRFSRYRKRTLIDEFLIVRTSRKCYRVIYFNHDFNHYQYFSCRSYKDCAERMKSIYRIFKTIEERTEPTHSKK